MKQPVFKLRFVHALRPHAPNHDDLIHNSSGAQQTPENADAGDSAQRSAYDCREQENGSEMNNRRSSERAAGQLLTRHDWSFGDKGYDHKLQADQRTGSPADDDIEISPTGKFGHAATSSRARFGHARISDHHRFG